MSKSVSLTTICAALAVFGAGALQIAIAIATIHDTGVRVAVIIATVAAILMDALVIHQIGTSPSNRLQKGLALAMLVSLFLGLALDIILLLTQSAFANETFGFLRVLVGVNIAVSLVVACGFFAASDTNTHERQVKHLRHSTEMTQAKAFLSSEEAANLYRAKITAELLSAAAEELGVPVFQLANLLGMNRTTALLSANGTREHSSAEKLPNLPHTSNASDLRWTPEEVAALLAVAASGPANGGGITPPKL